eukprot:Gb_22537 [translate_table: standard]
MEFVATGAGDVPDTPPIQATINDCSSKGGGRVRFPRGSYFYRLKKALQFLGVHSKKIIRPNKAYSYCNSVVAINASKEDPEKRIIDIVRVNAFGGEMSAENPIEGEEIRIEYFDVLVPFAERSENSRHWVFTYNYKRCNLERCLQMPLEHVIAKYSRLRKFRGGLKACSIHRIWQRLQNSLRN